ncbi:MAG: ABC-type transport auxiliary lipoprotein family protein [bacterium]
MKRNLLLLNYVVALLILSHCGGVPPTYYYRIDYELPNSNSANNIILKTLGVAQFEADLLYEGDRIVYRNSLYEVQFYHYRRWIAPPKKIVTEKVLRQFQASGMFQRVVSVPSHFEIDYILEGQINAFEEWDEGNSWYGMVTLDLELQDTETHDIVWKRELSEKTKALKREPVEVVKAISESLNKVIQKAIEEIESTLRQQDI